MRLIELKPVDPFGERLIVDADMIAALQTGEAQRVDSQITVTKIVLRGGSCLMAEDDIDHVRRLWLDHESIEDIAETEAP